MVIAGFDTATPSTAAAVLLDGGQAVERRDDPPEGGRPQHAATVLELLEQALADAGVGWDDVSRLAVGIGPGGFTGLRIGISTARALAQARGLELVGVSTLEALAAGAGAAPGTAVVAVLDARRGEAFAAAWRDGERLTEPAALTPEALEQAVRALPAAPLAVGDGAIRFRAHLERAGATVTSDDAPAHRVSAVQVCRLAAVGRPSDREALVPAYLREPDAKPPPRP